MSEQQPSRSQLAVASAGALVIVLALPAAYAGVIPLAAWALAAGLWTVNMALRAVLTRLSEGLSAPMAVGVSGIGMMARIWLAAIVIFLVGADAQPGGFQIGFARPDLAVVALILFALAFTVDIAARAMTELRRQAEAARAEAADEEDLS